MSKRLYYDDPYTTDFTTTIHETTEVDGRPAVVLEETYFYPEGGGQPADTGTIGDVKVKDVQVRKTDNVVLHLMDAPIAEGQADAHLDWHRRFDHMQQHTGQHILTQAFVQITKANTVGFHLSERTVTIDLDKGNLSSKKLDQVERLANEILFENRPVTARLYPLEQLPNTVRVRKIPDSMSTDGIRVIEVSAFDATACGGTHVAATGEVGLLKIINATPYKGGTRVNFACGWRAINDYNEKNHLMQQASVLLSAKHTDVPALIANLQADLKQKHNAFQAALAELAHHRARSLVTDTPIKNGIRLITLVDPELDAQLLASMLIEESATMVLIGQSGEKAHIIAARSEDIDHNMNQVLQAVFAELGGGRGGGRPNMVQGGGVEATAEQITAAFETATQALY